ncbi:MAG: hypothetical protein E7261_00830 [Lachnospiraceae bacterium]|nr:hypothetical protein [Lachnospiraceae bacterium]
MLHIKDYIFRELSIEEQEVAIEFVSYLERNNMIFIKDNCDYWKDKIYYWVKYNDKCVCFIAIKNPDEKENHWTVWSDDMSSEWLKYSSKKEEIKEKAWKYVDHCGNCGSCNGGRRKVIFGKEFDDVCGCTFRVDNPASEDLLFLKKWLN